MRTENIYLTGDVTGCKRCIEGNIRCSKRIAESMGYTMPQAGVLFLCILLLAHFGTHVTSTNTSSSSTASLVSDTSAKEAAAGTTSSSSSSHPHSCIYFKGSNVSQQMLVIRRDREDYCVISATTKDGHSVPCKGNAMATRINSTHVLLITEEELGNFTFMNYGTSTLGKHAVPYKGDCPNSTVEMENRKKTPENSRKRYGLYVAICLVLVISFIIGIYMGCKKDQSQRRGEAVCNGVTVDRLLENTEHIQQNGAPISH